MRHPIRDEETQASSTAIQKELQRRLDTIAAYPPDGDGVGTFTRIELLGVVILALALPWWVWCRLT